MNQQGGETGALWGGGQGESSAQKEDHSPAHLGLYQPPGDEAGGVLEAAVHRGKRPEFIILNILMSN